MTRAPLVRRKRSRHNSLIQFVGNNRPARSAVNSLRSGKATSKQGIYFFTPPNRQGRSDICLYKFATGKTSKILTIERAVYERIAVSPDERTILYGQVDQAGSDLMLVENFR